MALPGTQAFTDHVLRLKAGTELDQLCAEAVGREHEPDWQPSSDQAVAWAAMQDVFTHWPPSKKEAFSQWMNYQAIQANRTPVYLPGGIFYALRDIFNLALARALVLSASGAAL